MTQVQIIDISQVRPLLIGRPGLVLGQSLSTKSDFNAIQRDLAQIAESACTSDAIKTKIQVDGLDEALDVFAHGDHDGYRSFRTQAQKYFNSSIPGELISKLSKTSWSAVLSLARDPHIEQGIRAHLATKPTQRKVVVASSPIVLDRAALLLPVYRLLGDCQQDAEQARAAFSKSEYMLRVPQWRRLMEALPGFLREGGLLFLGTKEALPQVKDLLATIYSAHPPYPNYLVFSEEDPAGNDLFVHRLAEGRSQLYRVKATDRQIISSLSEAATSQIGLDFGSVSTSTSEHGELLRFRAIAEQLPEYSPQHRPSRKQEAIEGLFRPNDLTWDAFALDLDLARSRTPEISDAIKRVQDIPTKHPKFFVLRGEAGIGKTIIAKRLAIDFRKEGALVLWCKKTNGEFFHLYRELAKELRRIQTKRPETKILMFWDDPWALGLAPVEFAASLESEHIDLTVVIVGRNSDRAIARGFSRLPPITEEVELDFELTDAEERSLPEFLLRIGAARSLEDARHVLNGYTGRNASDILCRIWYLLPDARPQLENSLTDEYFRLETVDHLIEGIMESTVATSGAARRAYEAVAVASNLGFGVPDEVLVNALQINYSEWLSMCAGGKPLWGLLYPVASQQTEQYFYFTRNEIVTQILLRQINGGIGHAGEIRVLKSLVAGCNGSSPVYRDFLMELLVRAKEKLRKILTPLEGRELFELALQTFPVPDRTLVHHYAKWISDEVHSNKEAYELLQKALETADYPYAANEERREFIHTSMAAVIVQRVKRGEQDRESGLLAIKRHLREASSPSFFNLFTVHVQVNALVRLQQGDDPVSLDCFIEACRAIERAQQLAGSHGRRQLRHQDALNLLENQKRELANSLTSFARLSEEALARFDKDGDQLSLEAAALKGILEASLSDKGSDYNAVQQFIRRCQDRISSKNQTISSGLRQAKIDLVVRWRLQRDIGEVDWNQFLGDIRTAREEPSKRDDLLLLFYEGVACFHLKLIGDSQAAFSRLRSLQAPGPLLSQIRVFLRSKSGKPEQVQGILAKKPGRLRVRLTDFGFDALLYHDHAPSSAQDQATVHCWLGFTLQGPIAVFEQPDASELILPS